jgi:hypothetical protein
MAKVKLAMAEQGHQYSRDGFSLSWPFGGVREVVEVDEAWLEGRDDLNQRIANKQIARVDLKVTPVIEEEFVAGKLYEGGSPAALEVFEQPAGPVTTQVFDRAKGELVTITITSPVVEPDRATVADGVTSVQVDEAIAARAAEVTTTREGTTAPTDPELLAKEQRRAAGAEEPVEEETQELGDLTVVELRQRAADLGIETRGTKAELVERIGASESQG